MEWIRNILHRNDSVLYLQVKAMSEQLEQLHEEKHTLVKVNAYMITLCGYGLGDFRFLPGPGSPGSSGF